MLIESKRGIGRENRHMNMVVVVAGSQPASSSRRRQAVAAGGGASRSWADALGLLIRQYGNTGLLFIVVRQQAKGKETTE